MVMVSYSMLVVPDNNSVEEVCADAVVYCASSTQVRKYPGLHTTVHSGTGTATTLLQQT
jgi:hypothetical protein